MFEKATNLGLPHPWDGNGEVLTKEEFKEMITHNRNETPSTENMSVIDQYFRILSHFRKFTRRHFLNL